MATLSALQNLQHMLPYMTHSQWLYLVHHVHPIVHHLNHTLAPILGHGFRHPRFALPE